MINLPQTETTLQNQIIKLEQENQALRHELLKCILEKAISDEAMSRNVAKDTAAFFGTPCSDWYVLLLFHGKRPDTPPEVGYSAHEKDPVDVVSCAFSPALKTLGIPFFFPIKGCIGCLLNLNVPEHFDQSTKSCIALCAQIKSHLQSILSDHANTLVASISISRISQMDEGPRLLYRCANNVSERRTPETDAICSEYDLPKAAPSAVQQTISLESEFWRQIQQHAFFDAATTLEQLIHATDVTQSSLEHTLTSVFSRMEQVLHSIAAETGADISHDPELANMLPALTQSRTYQELRDHAYDILATLEDRFYTPPNSRNQKMPSIEQYIQQHYAEQSLGAKAISEHFKISSSYLSRIFKADMGIGVVEYIHRIRIDAAKKLLCSATSNLDEIAIQVGFSNRWVLIRTFKKLEGTTPGIYRTNHANTASF